MRGIFWTLLFSIGVAALLVWSGPLKRPIVALRLTLEEPPKSLPLPIAGVPAATLRDTWGAPRGNGRTHQGTDIFAPKGAPVTSTTRGLVFRVGENRLGGNVVWIFGPGRQIHYYAHLDRFGDFKPGDLVMPGDIVGFVGNTGNARATPPHLHYGIYTPGEGAINPFPLLQQKQSVLQPRIQLVQYAKANAAGNRIDLLILARIKTTKASPTQGDV
jgi:murein DD-endopeptidase MepM/ murein hydrolase activator NlpD